MAIHQKIIQCALGEFERQGVFRSPIDAITQAADVGKGTFYNYFDSKESLLAAWVRDLLGEALREDATRAESGEPPARRLFRLFADLMKPLDKRPRLAPSLVLGFLMLAQMEEASESPRAAKSASSGARSRSGRAGSGSAAASAAASSGDAESGAASPQAPRTLLQAVESLADAAQQQGAFRGDLPARDLAAALAGAFYKTLMLLATGESGRSATEELRGGLALALEGLAPAE